MLDHPAKLLDAALIGGDLRLQVGDVLRDVAARPGVVGEELGELLLAEAAAVEETEIVDEDAFLVDGGGTWRHRAGRAAADIRMMAARCDPEKNLVLSLPGRAVALLASC